MAACWVISSNRNCQMQNEFKIKRARRTAARAIAAQDFETARTDVFEDGRLTGDRHRAAVYEDDRREGAPGLRPAAVAMAKAAGNRLFRDGVADGRRTCSRRSSFPVLVADRCSWVTSCFAVVDVQPYAKVRTILKRALPAIIFA